ncbi:uncharacterized protein LOC120572782 [Perca fluviatilis]|uniref:uncharacterized protein LOC120572782 n=1 Tax=Perca fluviatilis TaxID=8168 RepID=UPI00196694BA|nr:uncharacterized protein LOC120572782 [Perca fluviatilis]
MLAGGGESVSDSGTDAVLTLCPIEDLSLGRGRDEPESCSSSEPSLEWSPGRDILSLESSSGGGGTCSPGTGGESFGGLGSEDFPLQRGHILVASPVVSETEGEADGGDVADWIGAEYFELRESIRNPSFGEEEDMWAYMSRKQKKGRKKRMKRIGAPGLLLQAGLVGTGRESARTLARGAQPTVDPVAGASIMAQDPPRCSLPTFLMPTVSEPPPRPASPVCPPLHAATGDLPMQTVSETPPRPASPVCPPLHAATGVLVPPTAAEMMDTANLVLPTDAEVTSTCAEDPGASVLANPSNKKRKSEHGHVHFVIPDRVTRGTQTDPVLISAYPGAHDSNGPFFKIFRCRLIYGRLKRTKIHPQSTGNPGVWKLFTHIRPGCFRDSWLVALTQDNAISYVEGATLLRSVEAVSFDNDAGYIPVRKDWYISPGTNKQFLVLSDYGGNILVIILDRSTL